MSVVVPTRDLESLFKNHLQRCQSDIETMLSSLHYDGLMLFAGTLNYYFADDQAIAFKPTPHFARLCPDPDPGHFLYFRPGQRPKLYLFKPRDFWHEVPAFADEYWLSAFEIEVFDQKAKPAEFLKTVAANCAYIGPENEGVSNLFKAVNSKDVTAWMDWNRCQKTPFEVECLKRANQRAAHGHRAAREAFVAGASEFAIHQAYLQAAELGEWQLPYGSIAALGDRSAILHYQNKRRQSGASSPVFLIDAGALYEGYGSDITRTYVRSSAHPVFQELVRRVEAMQQGLCAQVADGVAYGAMQIQTHHLIAQILLDLGVLNGLSAEACVDTELTGAFFPHGLGHMLGIQVHDVGGRQKNCQGDPCESDKKYPKVGRLQRTLHKGEVVTVEPGVYFIPMLLDEQRSGAQGKHLNGPLIDSLIPLGGVRIEDNIFIGLHGPENLTRPYLASDWLCT